VCGIYSHTQAHTHTHTRCVCSVVRTARGTLLALRVRRTEMYAEDVQSSICYRTHFTRKKKNENLDFYPSRIHDTLCKLILKTLSRTFYFTRKKRAHPNFYSHVREPTRKCEHSFCKEFIRHIEKKKSVLYLCFPTFCQYPRSLCQQLHTWTRNNSLFEELSPLDVCFHSLFEK